jgi:hypothetical protein
MDLSERDVNITKKEMVMYLKALRKQGHKTVDTPIPSAWGDTHARQLLILDPRNVKLKERRIITPGTGEESVEAALRGNKWVELRKLPKTPAPDSDEAKGLRDYIAKQFVEQALEELSKIK